MQISANGQFDLLWCSINLLNDCKLFNLDQTVCDQNLSFDFVSEVNIKMPPPLPHVLHRRHNFIENFYFLSVERN